MRSTLHRLKPVITLALLTPPAVTLATDMNPVIVTATRTTQAADDTLASVTVIDRDEIARSQARSLAELLVGRAGLDITTTGGYGTSSGIYMRGTNSNHVLILVDGMKLGSATSGTTAIEFLALPQIDRIEIVRGPRSSLYGAEAVGGVIQIFTKPQQTETGVQLELGAGSNALRTVNLTASVAGGRSRAHVTLGRLGTDGINAHQATSGPFGIDEPDDDGYRNNAVSINAGHNFSNGVSAELMLLRDQGQVEYDGTPNSTHFLQQATGLHLSATPTAAWHTSLRFGQTLDEQAQYDNDSYYSRFNTTRDHASWQNDITLSPSQLVTAGVDYQRDHVNSDTAFTDTSRANLGAFAQYQLAQQQHDLTLSMRNDDNDAFGNHATGAIAYGYNQASGLKFTGSYGTSFKAPTFNDLYWPSSAFYSGNPDLAPEQGKTIEFGVGGKTGGGQWDARVFRTDVEDLILYQFPTMANIGKARIDGLELRWQQRLGAWNPRIEATWLDPQNRDTGKVLPRRARQSARLDLDRALGRGHVGMTLLAQAGRYDNAANTTRLGGYGVVNLRGDWNLDKRWHARASIDNLFDKEYATVADYNTLGRTLFLALAYDLR